MKHTEPHFQSVPHKKTNSFENALREDRCTLTTPLKYIFEISHQPKEKNLMRSMRPAYGWGIHSSQFRVGGPQRPRAGSHRSAPGITAGSQRPCPPPGPQHQLPLHEGSAFSFLPFSPQDSTRRRLGGERRSCRVDFTQR